MFRVRCEPWYFAMKCETSFMHQRRSCKKLDYIFSKYDKKNKNISKYNENDSLFYINYFNMLVDRRLSKFKLSTSLSRLCHSQQYIKKFFKENSFLLLSKKIFFGIFLNVKHRVFTCKLLKLLSDKHMIKSS